MSTELATKPKNGFLKKFFKGAESSDLVVQTQTNRLIELAADKDFPVEKLEKLIALKNREEERAAKKEFDLHFAEMQAELPNVPKRGKNNYLGNEYALLEDMVRICRPTIARHGFSYRWGQEKLTENTVLQSIYVSGYGHTEKTSMEMNILEPKSSSDGKKAVNKNQERGSADTYAHRYLFKSAFGVVEEGLDNDGNTPGVGKTKPVYEDAVVRDMDQKLDGALNEPTVTEAPKPTTLSEAVAAASKAMNGARNKDFIGAIGAIFSKIRGDQSKLAIFTAWLNDPTKERSAAAIEELKSIVGL